MFKNAKILIPDTGPLITLEMINKLDLLLAPKMPVMVIDVVFEEVYDKNRKDNQVFLNFLKESNNPLINHHSTSVGRDMHNRNWRSLSPDERAIFKHAGELAIRDFVIAQKYNLSEYLVITEDNGVKGFFKNTIKNTSDKPYIVNTGSFLRYLEKKDCIPSAKDIIEEIKNSKSRNVF